MTYFRTYSLQALDQIIFISLCEQNFSPSRFFPSQHISGSHQLCSILFAWTNFGCIVYLSVCVPFILNNVPGIFNEGSMEECVQCFSVLYCKGTNYHQSWCPHSFVIFTTTTTDIRVWMQERNLELFTFLSWKSFSQIVSRRPLNVHHNMNSIPLFPSISLRTVHVCNTTRDTGGHLTQWCIMMFCRSSRIIYNKLLRLPQKISL